MKTKKYEVSVGPEFTTIIFKDKYIAFVDSKDYKDKLQYATLYCCGGYIMCRAMVNGVYELMPLTRYIIEDIKEGYEVDHIDMNPLNNRRSNLRSVPRSVNLRNRRKQSHGTNKYRSVYPSGKKYMISFDVDGVYTYAGSWENEKQAAWVVDFLKMKIEGFTEAQMNLKHCGILDTFDSWETL
jgi:hypothetical protein